MTIQPASADSSLLFESEGKKVKVRPGKFSPVVIILIATIIAMMLPPLVYLVQTSFYTINFDGSFKDFTLQYYIDIVQEPGFIRYTANTAVYALGSAALAIVLGGVQAWIVERTNTPMRKYVFLFSIVSLGIPGVLSTVAWLLILGRAGPVNELLMTITGSADPIINIFTMGGMIAVEGLSWTPLAFLLLSSVFRSADASFEEASAMSGAGHFRTFFSITAKLALPAVLALALLITIRAFESFEIPALVGLPGRVYVLATDIYSDVHYSMPANYGKAGAFSMALLVMVSVMLFYYHRLLQKAEKYRTITGKGFRPRVMNLGKLRYLTSSILGLYFIILIFLPIGYLIWVSFLPYIQPFSLESFSTFTPQSYLDVFSSKSLLDAIWNTLILGVVTATLTVAFTLACAWLSARKYRGAWLLDLLTTAPLVFPAIVLGVAFLQLYLQLPFAFYGTLASIIFASWIRFLPYGMRYCSVAILQIHPELEQASAISGATPFATFMRVVVPLVAPALMTCWLLVFLLSVGAVSLPILLVGPDSQLVSVAIFDMWEGGQIPTLAALGLCWTAFMTLVSGAFYLLARKYGVSIH